MNLFKKKKMKGKDPKDSVQVFSFLPHKYKDIWEKTQILFNKEIKTITDLNTLFYSGNSSLLKEIENNYPKEGTEFLKVYNNIRSLVLNIEKIFEKDEIQFLRTNTTNKIILTRKQVALIFILGFFNIFYLDMKRMNVYVRYSFIQILTSKQGANLSKGRSFLNYMTIIGKWIEEKNELLQEKITFIRDNKDFNIKDYPDDLKLCDIQFIENGSLFDADASFCIDFANQFIGGGVLGGGNVQEELLFSVEPEAIVSIFLMEKMSNNDAIRIDNLIQYSKYSGYGRTFKFEGNATNNNKLIKHNIIAIDAVCDSKGGIDKKSVERDFIKAYVGFNLINFDDENVAKLKKTIATGNWGCGVFGGDFELKFIQQWLAATYAGVETLYYYTFSKKEMNNIIKKLEEIKLINANDLYLRLIGATLVKQKVLEIILESNIDEKLSKINDVGNNDINNNKKKKSCCFGFFAKSAS